MYKFPIITQLTTESLLFNKNAYFIKHYEPNVSLFVKLGRDINISLLDDLGNKLEKVSENHFEVLKINEIFIPYAREMKISQYQLFFDKNLRIVDFVGSNSCFITPGLLKVVFEKHFSIQEIIGFGIVDESSVAEMKKQSPVIIKPTTKLNDNKQFPVYAKI